MKSNSRPGGTVMNTIWLRQMGLPFVALLLVMMLASFH
jgi:hypothetical protein